MHKSFKVNAGLGGASAQEFLNEGFIGISFGVEEELTQFNGASFEDFKNDINTNYWAADAHGRSKGSIAMTNRQLWQFGYEMQPGDIVVSQDRKNVDGAKTYAIGKIVGAYTYSNNSEFPHRREVEWGLGNLSRHNISAELNNYFKSGTTIVDLSPFTEEIQSLIVNPPLTSHIPSASRAKPNTAEPGDGLASSARTGFVLEAHLEEYMVRNWSSIDFGKTYDLYTLDGEIVGQQYPVDTGNIDILALSKDGKEFLVLELKRGKASDEVVGQIQRYMGYIKAEVAEPYQTVSGAIVALDDDLRIRRALSVTQNISFYQYEIQFTLEQR